MGRHPKDAVELFKCALLGLREEEEDWKTSMLSVSLLQYCLL